SGIFSFERTRLVSHRTPGAARHPFRLAPHRLAAPYTIPLLTPQTSHRIIPADRGRGTRARREGSGGAVRLRSAARPAVQMVRDPEQQIHMAPYHPVCPAS